MHGEQVQKVLGAAAANGVAAAARPLPQRPPSAGGVAISQGLYYSGHFSIDW